MMFHSHLQCRFGGRKMIASIPRPTNADPTSSSTVQTTSRVLFSPLSWDAPKSTLASRPRLQSQIVGATRNIESQVFNYYRTVNKRGSERDPPALADGPDACDAAPAHATACRMHLRS
ncbi:hypothetical protein EVAR_60568_1 [Eumeta japonica]|uniref:Uncharacterized protein n=1 Tax=Eumeta variegata TaxID=151549 RepID=A0A4C1YEG0_EUMVA|nr:hypothetical protein EVAR_60568_1 [Eumeta japonica]